MEADYALGYENGMIAAQVAVLSKLIALAEQQAGLDKYSNAERMLIDHVLRQAMLAVASVEVCRPTTEQKP